MAHFVRKSRDQWMKTIQTPCIQSSPSKVRNKDPRPSFYQIGRFVTAPTINFHWRSSNMSCWFNSADTTPPIWFNWYERHLQYGTQLIWNLNMIQLSWYKRHLKYWTQLIWDPQYGTEMRNCLQVHFLPPIVSIYSVASRTLTSAPSLWPRDPSWPS